VLLAQVAAGGTGVAIAPPAGWATVDATANGVSVRSGVYWHKAGASEPASYSFGLSVPAAAVAAVGAYYNVDGAAPIHAWSAATGTASTAMNSGMGYVIDSEGGPRSVRGFARYANPVNSNPLTSGSGSFDPVWVPRLSQSWKLPVDVRGRNILRRES
jgi:hypothetical protein